MIETVWAPVGTSRPAAVGASANQPRPGFAVVPESVRRAAEVLIRSEPGGTPTDGDARSNLLQAIDQAMPEVSNDELAALFGDAVERVLRPIDVHRRWPRGRRAAAVAACSSGADTTDHPLRLLLDGRRPTLACEIVCPSGGCLTGELTEPAATRLAGDQMIVTRMLQDPEERRRRIRREAEHLLGVDAPAQLIQHTERCLTAVVFDSVVDVESVRGLIGGLDHD